jgi:hypothetical protein
MTKDNSNQSLEDFEDNLTPETFSFIDVLNEVAYPKDTVTVYMNEAAAYSLDKISQSIKSVDDDDIDALDSMVADAEMYAKLIDESAYVFHLTGVSDDTIVDLNDIAEAEFESKKKPVKSASGRLDRILPQSEQANYLRYTNALMLHVHIAQIVSHDGRVLTAPSVDEIAKFMDKAPTSQKMKLQAAIQALHASSEAFENRIDADFLVKR